MHARPWMAFLAAAFAVTSGGAAADEVPRDTSAEPDRAWTVHVDNDLFALADRDRDYTAGVAFALGGDRARRRAPFLFRALTWFDHALALGPFAPSGSLEGRALELGLLLFTPQDLAERAPLFDDRPYASLLYASSTTLWHDDSRGVAYQTSLTLGMLGLWFGFAALSAAGKPILPVRDPRLIESLEFDNIKA